MKFAGAVWAALRGKRSTARGFNIEGDNTVATQLFQPKAPPGSPSWFLEMVEQSASRPQMEVVELTPALAKFMLDVNADNRSIRKAKVVQYASDMAHGRWVLNGEPIIVSRDGNLNDGQHRCLAVIDSNTPVPVCLMFGVERETRLTVDQGAMRSASDFLHMDGVPNSALSAAIARMVIAYEYSRGLNINQANYLSSAEIRERVATDPAIATAATFGTSNHTYSKKFAAGSLVGFAFYVLGHIDKADAKSFMERVCRGDGLKMKDPAHTLREKLMSEGRLPRDRKIALILKAWNFHRRGMKVAAGSLSKDLPFPALL